MYIFRYLMGCSTFVTMLCLLSSDIVYAAGNNGSFTLTVREYRQSADFDNYDTEMDSSYDYKHIDLNCDNVALILIDVWNYHPNDGWFKRAKKNIREKVKPLVQLMRKNNVKIIHIPHEYDTYGISPDVEPSDNKPPMIVRSNTSPKGLDVPDIFEGTNEIIIKEYDAEVLTKCLRDHGIKKANNLL